MCEFQRKMSSLGRQLCGERGTANAKTDVDVNEMSRPSAWLECRVRAAERQEAREAGRVLMLHQGIGMYFVGSLG